MHPSSISHSFSMDEYFPVSPSSTTPHYAVGVSNAPAKRKRVDPAPHDGATRIDATQSAVDPAASWFPTTQTATAATSWYTDSSLDHPFSHYALHTTSEDYLQGSSQASVTTAGSLDAFLQSIPQYASEPPPKRKQLDSAPYNSTGTIPSASRLPGPAMSYQLSNYAFIPSTETATSASSQESTPHYPQDASEPPSKRKRASNAPPGRVHAPSRRGASSKRRHVSNAPPTNSALPGTSMPSDDLFRYPADLLPYFTSTPPTAAGSPFDGSFVEGSSSTPNALLRVGEAPSPATYPHYSPDDFMNALSVQDYELPQLFLGSDGLDFPDFAGDDYTWGGTAYNNAQAHGPTASGPSHGLTSTTHANGPTASSSSHSFPSSSFPPATAPAPSRRKRIARPLENYPPEPHVTMRRHHSDVVTYFNPHTADDPLPTGTRLQLACRSSQDPEDERVRCLYHSPFDSKHKDCNKDFATFSIWKRHFMRHAVAEGSYVDSEDHPNAFERAVALKDPKFAEAAPWKCEKCDTKGKRSTRGDALRRHQRESKRCKLLAEKRRREGADGGAREYVFVP